MGHHLQAGEHEKTRPMRRSHARQRPRDPSHRLELPGAWASQQGQGRLREGPGAATQSAALCELLPQLQVHQRSCNGRRVSGRRVLWRRDAGGRQSQ
ncbi:hypothetical protein D3C84_1112500 [compost metagenome]